ncbi:peptidoglycan DD-metalloendopeptidase family protein, partial [Treponema sp.]|uniref:peptidoglycan DD-metalloendopeptidase family protein n=1 Tax=Treponema sp. TaxID=166 RepID=UPI00389049EE
WRISFDSKSDYEFEALNNAMSRFAMDGILSDNIDENGNVLGEDGSLLSSGNPGLGLAVSFQSYTVKSGDSISTISRKFGLSNISTLIAVNDISNVRTLRSGQKLKIPSMDGLIHKVSGGESLNSLSVKYHVSVEELLDVNDLDSEVLTKNMELFIPGAKLDSNSLKKAMGELFVYPITASWRLSSKFGPRKDPFTGVASNHTGVDMACPTGTPVRSAMSGTVVVAGWSNVFGNYIIINHGNGYQSLYGHLSKIIAKKGQSVDSSTKIGLVGSTGYSTGPHLHFTVYKNGQLVDPLSLLKK